MPAGFLFCLLFFAIFRLTGAAGESGEDILLKAPVMLQVLGPCLLVPVSEELAWRGLFYPRLKQYIPKKAAALLGAGMFALGHAGLMQTLYAFPMALMMTVICEKDGEKATGPILFHMGANLGSVALALILS